jgi:D-tyrosyl-tRNA(Tyr) deacylase
VFVCFLKGTTAEEFTKLYQSLLTSPSFGPADQAIAGSRYAYDILIIPQAGLIGKFKSKAVQYHGLIDKTEGAALYEAFCKQFQAEADKVNESRHNNGNNTDEEKAKSSEKKIENSENSGSNNSTSKADLDPAINYPEGAVRVLNGVYGNRQGLKVQSYGPNTHFLEF